MTKLSIALLAATALAVPGAAHATAVTSFEANNPVGAVAFPGERVATGGFGDLTWTARSLIVGMTPTAGPPPPRNSGPGDPIFHGNPVRYSGVVPIIMQFGTAGFICSASLVNRNTLVTAAHCVSDGAGTPNPDLTTAWFKQDRGPSDHWTDADMIGITISDYFVHPLYTGQVIDQHDLAFLRLSTDAPEWAAVYDMALDIASLRAVDFNVAGYGNRSLVGGCGPNPGCTTGGATAGSTGFLRQGDNMFDYRFGDPIFGDAWYSIIGPQSRTEFSYVSDFDSGLAVNDQSCRVAQATNIIGPAGAIFCNLGRGATEVGVAGGDSGGPQFDALGRIVSVTSYGLSFGTAFGDCRPGLQSSCGEMNGFVPLYANADWIRTIIGTPGGAIPEPATWAMMIAGFGFIGGALRRRRKAAVAA